MRELLRKNIADLDPYRCARNDFSGNASVYLDANENWQGFVKDQGENRYPDPLCVNLRRMIEEKLGLPFEKTVVGNGSDEIIDNLMRMFCVPGKDRILLLPPTYGAYRVFADINDVRHDAVPLDGDFQIDFPSMETYFENEKSSRNEGEGRCKLLFLCTPNNPTGNAFPLDGICRIADSFDGITVVDEAYFDFSSQPSAVTLLSTHPRLVVLRTLSKSWGLANARIGILVASEEICNVMRSMKYPYNVSGPAQAMAMDDLSHRDAVREGTRKILEERKRLEKVLPNIPCVRKLWPSDANFFLTEVADASAIYRYLMEHGVIVRNRDKELHCGNCLRLTVGSRKENDLLVTLLKEWKR